jgi:hypothetical protein
LTFGSVVVVVLAAEFGSDTAWRTVAGGIVGLVVDEVGWVDWELTLGDSVALVTDWLGVLPELGLPTVGLGSVSDGIVDPAVVVGELSVVVVGGGAAGQMSV